MNAQKVPIGTLLPGDEFTTCSLGLHGSVGDYAKANTESVLALFDHGEKGLHRNVLVIPVRLKRWPANIR